MTGASDRQEFDGDVADSPSDAFQLVGNEIRTALLQTVATEGPCRFATLAEESDVETTAGVAYHLRQLDDLC